jgi:hypothetical protein
MSSTLCNILKLSLINLMSRSTYISSSSAYPLPHQPTLLLFILSCHLFYLHLLIFNLSSPSLTYTLWSILPLFNLHRLPFKYATASSVNPPSPQPAIPLLQPILFLYSLHLPIFNLFSLSLAYFPLLFNLHERQLQLTFSLTFNLHSAPLQSTLSLTSTYILLHLNLHSSSLQLTFSSSPIGILLCFNLHSPSLPTAL